VAFLVSIISEFALDVNLGRYNDGVLARANPTEEVTEMFCNFDCASLLKLLCGFFGC